jgi:hypothetical protein
MTATTGGGNRSRRASQTFGPAEGSRHTPDPPPQPDPLSSAAAVDVRQAGVMTDLLARAAGYFLAPADTKRGSTVAAVPAAARAVVLGSAQDAPALAAALALTQRAADRAPAAVVAVWRGDGDRGRPAPGAATPAAARLAARLSRRGLPAAARGRLVWLELPAEPEDTAAGLHRAAAAVDGPVVTALTGPRPTALETVIDEHDLVLVAADPDTPLARAALDGLSQRGVSALACRPLPRGLPRALALAGVAAPRLDPPLTVTAAEPR